MRKPVNNPDVLRVTRHAGDTDRRAGTYCSQYRFDPGSGRWNASSKVSSTYGTHLDRRSKRRQPPVRFTFNRAGERTGPHCGPKPWSQTREDSGAVAERIDKQTTLRMFHGPQEIHETN